MATKKARYSNNQFRPERISSPLRKEITRMMLRLLFAMTMVLPLHAMQFELSNERFDIIHTNNLFITIENSDLDGIRQAIHNNADPNAICSYTNDGEEYHCTPLEHALFIRHKSSTNVATSVLETLIELGADVDKINTKNRFNSNPLRTAIRHLDYGAVSLLLQHNVNIHVTAKSGATPLHLLCQINPHQHTSETDPLEKKIEAQKNIAKALLQTGALITPETGKHDPIPLMLAAGCANYFLIPILMEYGANIHRGSPLCVAASEAGNNPQDSARTIKTILGYGVNPYQKTKGSRTFREMAATYKSIKSEYQDWKKAHKKTFDCQKAFLEAARAGELKARAKFLQSTFARSLPALPLEVIKRIFDFMNMPWTGQNFLDLYQKKFVKQELKEFLAENRELNDEALQQKVESYCTHEFPGREILGRPPIHWILKQTNDVRVLEQFVHTGMQKDEKDSSGNTLLHTAVMSRKITPALIEYLKDMVNVGDALGITPLGASVFNKDDYTCDIPKALIEVGKADIHAINQEGATILHLAALSGHKHMIQFFIERGLKTDACDNDNNTPLHDYLMHNLNSEDTKGILELFFEANAPFDITNNDGQDCLTLAAQAKIPLYPVYKEWLAKTKPSLKDKAKKKLKKLKNSLSFKKKE